MIIVAILIGNSVYGCFIPCTAHYDPITSFYWHHRKLANAVGLSMPLYEHMKVDLSLSVFNTCSGTGNMHFLQLVMASKGC